MKITCPKCQASYKVDLPDPGEAGIDVQCGNCRYIFLFSSDSELPEDHTSEPILPPQKDEDQEISGPKKRSLQAKKQPPSSPEKDRDTSEELELEPILDDAEPIEIVVEDEIPEDSLEKEALDNIWDQAVEEGARTIDKSTEKPPTPPSGQAVAETADEETLEETPPPPVKKSKQLPSLEDRQREIDQMIADHQAKQGESGEKPTAEKSQPPLTQKDPQQEKTQEEIDLEEQVVIDEREDTPNWEEAFADQSEVEAGWKMAQKQDQILEEQQLAEASSKQTLPEEPATEEKTTAVPQEDKQSLVDDIFAEVKDAQETSKAAAETPQPKSEADQKQDEVGQIFAEANSMPSWEEAFADQSEVEAGWGKAQVEDRIHEEQQLADALGEEYVPTEAPAEEIPATQEDKQNLVDQLFAEAQSQRESAEQPEAITQDEPLEVSGEKPPSPEIQETHVDQHTIPGAIDLMTDLDDLNMKQLVTQAFKEEAESQEDSGHSPPETPTTGDEVIQETELAMESVAETLQETGPPPEDPIPELEMESTPELTLESAEEEPEPVETVAQEEESEIEPEPELTMESQEATAPSAEQPAVSQESSYDDEAELWANLLPEPEEEEEEQPMGAEAPVAFTEEEGEGEEPFGGNDFWDQVLEKDAHETQTDEAETAPQPVVSAPVAMDTAERETLTDEELWKQAFPGEEKLEPTPSQYSGEEEEDSQLEVAPLVVGANVKPNEELEDSLEYDETTYEDDDDDEFEFRRRKRKLGPFTIPHGRRGDLVIGGAMVVFLLIAGSVYFTLQTFAPGELTDIQTAETDVPEGLSPREVPLDELAGDLTSPKPPKPEKTPPVDTPGDKGEAILSDPSKILEESPEEKGILKDLAESQILKDTGKSQTAKIDQSALQALTGHSVTMSTIMPVAYNPTDIRVLSFSVEMQLSDAKSAKMVRESLPVYEEIMNQTVENLLRRKFYNDVLYVKEKLQKRLQTAMNKSLKRGRVKKTKFVDFAIQ